MPIQKASDNLYKILDQLCVMPGLQPCLYYMMSLANFKTVRKHGLVSRNVAVSKGIFVDDYSDQAVQMRRASKIDPIYNCSIHDYVPLYFNPRNPMLYSLRERSSDLVVLGFSPTLVDYHQKHLFADGNASSYQTIFSTDPSIITSSVDALNSRYWNNIPDGKRRRCAETLIAPSLAPGFIEFAICSNHLTADVVNDSGLNLDDRIIVEPDFFFLEGSR